MTTTDNQTMMQYFEWNLPADGLLWERLAIQAPHLKEAGIDIMWLPPAYKGAAGGMDVGYGVYDMYDLGEFDQKGSVRTKYGTRDEYLRAIHSLQGAGIAVYADIVMNHRMGADEKETVEATKFDYNNRTRQVSGEEQIEAWTRFTFPGRKGKYSDFIWDHTCFSGIDWDDKDKDSGVFLIEGKQWADDVSTEKGNFDYLMGADVDMNNPAVTDELIRWGRWYARTTGVDGYRLDAVKHIEFSFFDTWLDAIREEMGVDAFAVGEYWTYNLGELLDFMHKTGGRMSLFDVPLHFNFYNASHGNGGYDMGSIFNNTMISVDKLKTVTFVDNHDSQPGQSLESWVEPWFKPLAYAMILLRRDGLPCVFYADYYGLRDDGVPAVAGLRRMLKVRQKYAYGEQHDYFDHRAVVGWTRSGDDEHPDSGCAVLMSGAEGGEKTMYIGPEHKGRVMRDVTRRCQDVITVGEDGNALFFTKPGGVSVYVFEPAYRNISLHID
ncbi:alpha-amylase [Eubacteriales bacterium OttesenSCG-928-A19]|nr:alpha-amylase [Eubacteriales bacterium OttesenSCG-928-A19]